MTDAAQEKVKQISGALRAVDQTFSERQRYLRRLLDADEMERLVLAKLLREQATKLFGEMSSRANSLVLVMDRTGGGDGAKAVTGLLPLIGQFWPGASLIHVAFATPTQGLGALIRSALVRAGAENGIVVDVVAYDRPAEGLENDRLEAEGLTQGCDMVITLTPAGVAGLNRLTAAGKQDQLLARSHIALQSYVDPESLIASLPALERQLATEGGLERLVFTVEAEFEGRFGQLGTTTLGPGGDAPDRLWVLVDNAKRRRYRILIEPWGTDGPLGDALVYPCRSQLERELAASCAVNRVVPAGSHLVAVCRGKLTLI